MSEPEALEDRTRVVFNLPLKNPAEERAIADVIKYLRRGDKIDKGLGGFTLSNVYPPAFKGAWWDDETKQWVDDNIVMFTVDFMTPSPEHQYCLMDELAELKRYIEECYAHHGSKQQEVWMTMHPISRVK